MRRRTDFAFNEFPTAGMNAASVNAGKSASTWLFFGVPMNRFNAALAAFASRRWSVSTGVGVWFGEDLPIEWNEFRK